MRTVQILGMAPNIQDTPDIGAERWCSNSPRSYMLKWPPALDTYTRWFNMHSKRHMLLTYPRGYKWYGEQDKPIYLQEAQPDIPTSITFPRHEIQSYFSIDGSPFKYFTCSGTWFIAFAIMEGFERIELWGFELKRDHQYDFERPCFSYWVNRGREMGVDIYLPPEVDLGPPGDPTTYNGPIYGYQTTLPYVD